MCVCQRERNEFAASFKVVRLIVSTGTFTCWSILQPGTRNIGSSHCGLVQVHLDQHLLYLGHFNRGRGVAPWLSEVHETLCFWGRA